MLEKCGFFRNFKGNSEVVTEGWIKKFCENQEKSERCARKKYRKMNGKPPADNMTPTGKIITI
jgi:hypothetical protein